MIKSALLTMSLMGSTMFIAYVILRSLLKRLFSVGIRIKFLLASVFFYLFPFPAFKYYYYDLVSMFYKFDLTITGKVEKYSDITHIYADGTVIYPKIITAFAAVTILVLIVSLVLMLFRYKNYKKLKKGLIQVCAYNNENNISEIVNEYKGSLHIKRGVDVLIYDKQSPVTLGFIKPKIFLSSNIPDSQKIYIIKHELAHIRHKDYIIKLLMIAVCILHWFNPLVYIMTYEMNRLLEYYADEEVVADYDNNERKEYGNAIIDISSKNDIDYNLNIMPINPFGSKSFKSMKERLIEMKNVKNHGSLNKFLSCIVLAAIVIANSMLVFAYDDSHAHGEEEVNAYSQINADEIENTEVFLVTDDEVNPFAAMEDTLPFTDDSSTIIIDENGQIIPISGGEQSEPDASCNHTFASGTTSQHTTNSSGGCTVKTYSCQYCTKCGYVTNKVLKSTVTYTVCPH